MGPFFISKYIYVLLIFLNLTVHGFSQDYSIKFDGQNDYVLIPDNSLLDMTQDYTLEAWIFPESFSWLAGIISKYHTNAANGYILRLTNQSPYTGLGFDELITSTNILSANQWYHIAAVKNGSNRKIYINGIEFSLTGSALNVNAIIILSVLDRIMVEDILMAGLMKSKFGIMQGLKKKFLLRCIYLHLWTNQV